MKLIGGVIVSVLAWSAVDRGRGRGRGGGGDKTKDYRISIICCFSTKPTALRSKTGLHEIRIMYPCGATYSNRGLLFQWANTKKVQLSILV